MRKSPAVVTRASPASAGLFIPGAHDINASAPALPANEALVPVGDGRRGAVARSQVSQIGLDLMTASQTHDDQRHTFARDISERHRT